MDNVKQAKGKVHIHALKNVMHSVKVLPKGICGMTSNSFGQTHSESAKIFLEAGIKVVQYTNKANPTVEEALGIKKLCGTYGALFIVDGRLDLAIASGADGLHLHKDYAGIEDARGQFNGIIGTSAASVGEAFRAQESAADYLCIGAMFASDSNSDSRIVPFEEFRRIRDKVSLPIYAFGGITENNVQMIKKLGADGIAVKSAVLDAKDPRTAAAAIIKKWAES